MSVPVLPESYLARFLLILQTSPPLFLQFFAVFAIAIFGRLLIPVSSTRHFNTLDLLRCPSELSLKLLKVCCLFSSWKDCGQRYNTIVIPLMKSQVVDSLQVKVSKILFSNSFVPFPLTRIKSSFTMLPLLLLGRRIPL